MCIRLILLLILLYSGKVLAIEFPIEITEYADGVRIVAYLNKNDINEKSRWRPFHGAPPLSINDALQAVQQHINSRPDAGHITITEIELRQIPHHKGYWHYLIKAKQEVNEGTHAQFFIVLMDGKVISAIREPESIK